MTVLVTYDWWTGFYNKEVSKTKTFEDDETEELEEFLKFLKSDGGSSNIKIWKDNDNSITT